MGAIVLTKDEVEEIKCPLVMIADEYGIVKMKNVTLRGVCNDGSPIIQEQGQQRAGSVTKALIIEKKKGWTILPQNTKRGKK